MPRLNRVKKLMRCLKCGRRMWTDRCHRICPRCSDENAGIVESPHIRSGPQSTPITPTEIACYGLKWLPRQTCGEMELTLDE